jgi:hypothetical protein
MSGPDNASQSHNTPSQFLGGTILCCSSIRVTSAPKPLLEPAHIAERMMFFLCSYWAGKEVDQDTGTSASELLIAANFSGVIRVSEHTSAGTRYATNSRWFASYHPDHPKASKVAPINGRGTGPDGRYMEISEAKAMEEIVARRLVDTGIEAEYGKCKIHPQAPFLAHWFDLRYHATAIKPSSGLVISGIIENLLSPGAPQRCNRCKGSFPAGEFRANIYNGRAGPGQCFACQGYRRYDEPQRKSRAKAGRSRTRTGKAVNIVVWSHANRVAASHPAIASRRVDSGPAIGNSEETTENRSFDESQLFDDYQFLAGYQEPAGNHEFVDNREFGSNQEVVCDQEVAHDRMIDSELPEELSEDPGNAVDNNTLIVTYYAWASGSTVDYDFPLDPRLADERTNDPNFRIAEDEDLYGAD